MDPSGVPHMGRAIVGGLIIVIVVAGVVGAAIGFGIAALVF